LNTPENPDTAPRCAIYCRYSSEQQRDSMSIEAQKRACSEFAERQKWNIARFYIDEARSGTSDDRANFQAMIADATAKDKPFDYIVVHKLDRFARNRYDSIKYKHLLNRKGVRVVSASQPIIGSGDPTEVLLESILEGMDEFYSLNLAREAIKGMAENARNGWYNGGHPPYGFDFETVKTAKGAKKKLVVNSAEAKIVRRIYRDYLSGSGIIAIRNGLNADGSKNRSGRPWTKNVVTGILKNEKYAGDMAFGKRPNRARRNYAPKYEAVIVKNCHEAIVSREDHEEVQRRLARNHPSVTHPRAVASEYLFSGIAKCRLCGGHMKGLSAHGRSERYRYYVCSVNDRVNRKACPQRKIRANVIEEIVIAKLKERLTSREVLEDIIRINNEALKELKAKSEKTLERIEADIARIEQKRRRLFEAIEDGIGGLASEDIAPRLRELQEKKTEAEAERERIKASIAQKPIKSSEEILRKWVEFFKALFDDPDFWKNKARIHSLIESIEIDASRVYVTYCAKLKGETDVLMLDKDPPPDGGGGGGKAVCLPHGAGSHYFLRQTVSIDLKEIIAACRRRVQARPAPAPEFQVSGGRAIMKIPVPSTKQVEMKDGKKIEVWELNGHVFVTAGSSGERCQS